MTQLLLASESKYRKRLLSRLGLPFETCTHRADETVRHKDENFTQLAARLADEKAQSVRTDFPDACIIGSDQIAVAFDKRNEDEQVQLHKPGSRDAAIKQLRFLSGCSHMLLTAVSVRFQGRVIVDCVHTHMHMRELSDEEITHYVDFDEPFDCCGSYKIESLGISLFRGVEGRDPTAIEGLPLMSVASMLREIGFPLPWGPNLGQEPLPPITRS